MYKMVFSSKRNGYSLSTADSAVPDCLLLIDNLEKSTSSLSSVSFILMSRRHSAELILLPITKSISQNNLSVLLRFGVAVMKNHVII